MVRTTIARKKIFGASLIVVMSLVVIALSLFSKFLNITHWFEIQFAMVSYHPWIPIIGLVVTSMLLTITYVKRQFWVYYIMFGFGIIYNIFLLYGVLVTNGMGVFMFW